MKNLKRLEVDLSNNCQVFGLDFTKTPWYELVYSKMIDDLESKGLIVPNKTTLVEVTSGNSGKALQNVAGDKYNLELFIPQVLGENIIDDLKNNYNGSKECRVIATDENYKKLWYVQVAHLLALRRAKKRTKEGDVFYLNHSGVSDTILALSQGLSNTFDLRELKGKHILTGLGNGTTPLALSEALYNQNITPSGFTAIAPATNYTIYDQLHGKGSHHKNFGIEYSHLNRVFHNIPGLVVPDIKFPFISTLLKGGELISHTSSNSNFRKRENLELKLITSSSLTAKFEEFSSLPCASGNELPYGPSTRAQIEVIKEDPKNNTNKGYVIMMYDSDKRCRI